jgi:hypothetical protein
MCSAAVVLTVEGGEVGTGGGAIRQSVPFVRVPAVGSKQVRGAVERRKLTEKSTMAAVAVGSRGRRQPSPFSYALTNSEPWPLLALWSPSPGRLGTLMTSRFPSAFPSRQRLELRWRTFLPSHLGREGASHRCVQCKTEREGWTLEIGVGPERRRRDLVAAEEG